MFLNFYLGYDRLSICDYQLRYKNMNNIGGFCDSLMHIWASEAVFVVGSIVLGSFKYAIIVQYECPIFPMLYNLSTMDLLDDITVSE